MKGIIDPRYPSLAIAGNESSLFLVITNLNSSDRRDFSSRNIYTHLVLKINQDQDIISLQTLAANILENPEKFRKDIDQIVRHSGGKNNNKGCIVDRDQLNRKLGEYWNQLKVSIGDWDKFNESINNIIHSDKVKLRGALRKDDLFRRNLKEYWEYISGLSHGNNQQINPTKTPKDNFIKEINEIVNYLEIGFIVDEKKAI